MLEWITKQARRLRRAYRSLTVNWGGLLIVVGALHDNIEQFLPLVKLIIPNQYVGAFVSAIGVVVVLLRFKTTKPLEDR